MIWQSELNADAFSGRKRNLRVQSHTPFADIYGVAANCLKIFALDDDWNRDGVTELASPFLHDEPICRLEGLVD